MRAERLLAAGWLLLVLGAALALGAALRDGLRVDTDLLALLPDERRDVQLGAALRALDRQADGSLVLLVGAPDRALAAEAADRAVAVLRESAVIASADSRLQAEDWQTLLDSYADHAGLLLSPQDREMLATGRGEALLDAAIRTIHAPAGPRLLPIAEDPLGLHARFLASLPRPAVSLQPEGGRLVARDGQRTWVLVRARTRDTSFALADPGALPAAVNAAAAAARDTAAEVEVLRAGVPLHAAAAAARARSEMQTIGTASLIGALLLAWFAFRSPLPVAMTLLAIASGWLAGLAACASLFGAIHLVTLVFGASLVGLAVDYVFHWFAAAAGSDDGGLAVQRCVRAGLLMGLATTVVGYGGLLPAPFPGLQQMAVFAIAGLTAACLTVLMLFPAMTPHRRRPALAAPTRRLAAGLLDMPPALRRALWLAPLLAALALPWLQADDDLRRMHGADPVRIDEDRRVFAIIGAPEPSRMLLVTAADTQRWLEHNEALLARLEGLPVQPLSLAVAVPSAARQRADRALLAQVYAPGGLLDRFAARTGLADEAVERLRNRWLRAAVLTPEQWIAANPHHPLAASLVVAPDGMASGLVRLAALGDWQAVASAARDVPGVRPLDRVDLVGDTLSALRRQAALLLAAAWVLAAALLGWRYGAGRAARVLAAPLGATLVVLGGLALCGMPFTVFHLLACMLLLGLSADYAIFQAEARDASHRLAVSCAILLAGATTLLAFGMLALSSTPALAAFGFVIALGVPSALLLAAAGAGSDR